jgi:hypothetical protein
MRTGIEVVSREDGGAAGDESTALPNSPAPETADGPEGRGGRTEANGAWIAALIGVAVFLLCCDPRIVLPGRAGWLMDGDPAQHYLGWQFFRNAPLLQFPLGANPLFGERLSSTIVFTDSLPLFAFLFKPFRALLPTEFQYEGIWVLICFVLQAVFAYKLLRCFTDSRRLALLGAALFALSPPLIWRLYGHYTLMGHWLIVAAYSEYFAVRHKAPRWAALLACAALVHAYLLVMVGGIWAAELLQRRHAREVAGRAVAAELGLIVSGLVLVMWVVGYFVLGGEPAGAGYNFFRMNLLAPLDPNAEWSLLLRDQYHVTGEYEGFNFFGIGIWLLIVWIAPGAWTRGRPKFRWRRHWPLSTISLLFFLFAISNRIYFGHYKVASYHLGHAVERAFNVFRASGRMFWPVLYLIFLFVLITVWRSYDARVARRLTAAALCVQLIDMSTAFSFFRDRESRAMGWTTPLRSPLWLEAAERYRRVLVVPPGNGPGLSIALARFAADHALSINSVYYNRFDEKLFDEEAASLYASIRSRQIDPAAIYVFATGGWLWESLKRDHAAADFVGVVDGERVLAPGLARFERVRGEPEPEPADRHRRRGRRGNRRSAAGAAEIHG